MAGRPTDPRVGPSRSRVEKSEAHTYAFPEDVLGAFAYLRGVLPSFIEAVTSEGEPSDEVSKRIANAIPAAIELSTALAEVDVEDPPEVAKALDLDAVADAVELIAKAELPPDFANVARAGDVAIRSLVALRDECEKIAIADISPERLRRAPRGELLQMHLRLHQLYAANFADTDRTTTPGMNREDLVNAEIFVQNEMERRGYKHEAEDALTEEAERLRKFSPFQPRDDHGMWTEDDTAEAGGRGGGAVRAARELLSDTRRRLRNQDFDNVKGAVFSRLNERQRAQHLNFMNAWTEESTKTHGIAAAVLAGTATREEEQRVANRWFGRNVESMKQVLATQYVATQMLLERRNIRELTLYRSIDGRLADAVRRDALNSNRSDRFDFSVRGLSSWSRSRSASESFGETTIRSTLPASSFFAHDRLQGGPIFADLHEEQEVVVFAPQTAISVGPQDVEWRNWEGRWGQWTRAEEEGD